MKTHIIKKITEEEATAINWEHIPTVSIDTLLWTDPIDISAYAQICYNSDALFLRLFAKEQRIRATHTGKYGMPCEDSCLEFFFSPVPGDSRYLNIEFNPNGAMYLGIGSSIRDLLRLIPNGENPLNPNAAYLEDGWEIVYHVPTELIRRLFPAYDPKSGSTIRANFYKCGDLTEKKHYLSWNPVTSCTHAFHVPSDFGTLIFE